MVIAAVLAAGSADAKIQTQSMHGGALRVMVDSKPSPRAFPLTSTTMTAHITGHVAQVAVQQKFNNPFKKALEAVYVFPLPQNAAVSAMRIRIGGRTITSVVKPRDVAQKIYERAKRAGRTVASLNQERANIFTQSVANIAAGKDVIVELTYDVELHQLRGVYEFVYPMVVGPRHIPGTPTGKPSKGGGRLPDTDKVPDASRVTPPILKPGTRSAHVVNVEVTIDPGQAMKPPTSPTHKIVVTSANDAKRPHAVVVRLAKSDRVPNKDLVVRYRLAGAQPSVGMIAHKSKLGGFFSLAIQPPVGRKAVPIAPKQMVFVIDTSGSMAGEPLALIKRALRYALRHLGPKDTFQLVPLATGKPALQATPFANTPAKVRRALSFVNGLTAGGSSELLAGMPATLAGRASSGRLRIVVLISDGYVGNDAAVLAAVRAKLGPSTRLFPLGVGSSVNRSLLERMAMLGRGVADVLLLREKPAMRVKAMYDRVRRPVLTNVRIDWKGLHVADVTPTPLPDVLAGRPLYITGRYDRPGEATAVVHAKYGGKDVSFRVPVSLPSSDDGYDVLARLWARAQIRQRMLASYGRSSATDIGAITKLGMRYGLVTKYTTLVAEDNHVVNPGGKVRTFYVPVEMPQGVSYKATLREGTVRGGLAGGATSHIDEDEPEARKALRTRRVPAAGGESISLSTDYRAVRRWHVELGLSSGIVAEEDGFGNAWQTQLNVYAARTLSPSLRLGVDFMLYLPRLESERGGSQFVFRAGYWSLLRGRLELGGGLGLAFPFDDKIGIAFLATGVYRLPRLGPIVPRLQLRYEGNHVPLNGHDTRSFTVGAAFGF